MAHVRPKPGRFCVNVRPGKPSYITLTCTDGDFTATTQVLTVQDTVHGLDWEPTITSWTATELRVRLRALASATPIAKGAKSVKGAPPDSGSLTVTIRAPIKTVDPIPVDYVDDNAP
jgi:hypothetical protein